MENNVINDPNATSGTAQSRQPIDLSAEDMINMMYNPLLAAKLSRTDLYGEGGFMPICRDALLKIFANQKKENELLAQVNNTLTEENSSLVLKNNELTESISKIQATGIPTGEAVTDEVIVDNGGYSIGESSL